MKKTVLTINFISTIIQIRGSYESFNYFSWVYSYWENIEKIDDITLDKYSNVIGKQYDLILSTEKIESSNRVIYVNSLLNDNEQEYISLTIKRHIKKKNININKLIPENLFKIVELEDKDTLLELLLSNLVEFGYVDNRVRDSIIERETLGNTDIGNLIAIPHPLSYTGDKFIISIFINRKPILWNDSFVQIVFCVLIPQDRHSDWNNLFRQIYKNLTKDMIGDFIKRSTYKYFIEKIDEVLEETNDIF